jgi:hypothetical protein
MTARQGTCEERVDGELVSTERQYSDLWRQLDAAAERGDNAAEAECHAAMEPPSLGAKRVLKIIFSWGGPSDWLEVELDRHERGGYEVAQLTHHFADWFDHAERAVSESEAPALWRLAEHCAADAELYEH